MPNIIDQIETTSGLAVMNYKTQGNLPQSDKGLTQDGGFADGAVTGERINRIQNLLIDENGELIKDNIALDIKNIKKTITDIEGTISDENGHGKLISDNANAIKTIQQNFTEEHNAITKMIIDNKSSIAQNADNIKILSGKYTEISDWNNATKTGYYYSNSSAKNIPELELIYIYGQTIAFSNDHNINFIYQVIYVMIPKKDNKYTYDICERMRTPDDNWTDWRDITMPDSNFTEDEINSIFTIQDTSSKTNTTDSNTNSDDVTGNTENK